MSKKQKEAAKKNMKKLSKKEEASVIADDKADTLTDEELAAKVEELAAELAGADDETEETASTEGETTNVAYDIAASVSFDVNTVRVVPVRPGLMAVFAETASSGTLNLGLLHEEKASANNRDLFRQFSPAKLQAVNEGFKAAMKTNDDLSPFGFASTIVNVPVKQVHDQALAQVEEAAAKEADEAIKTDRADYGNALAIAGAGMIKGLFENPLSSALSSALTKRRVTNADVVVASVLGEVLAGFTKAMTDKANELMAKTPEARAEIASLIKDTKARQVSAKPAADETSDLEVSTAFLNDETLVAASRGEPKASGKPASKEVASTIGAPKKRLFKVM
jgi:hypothetical protein